MFNNIGKKIKGLAKVCFIIGAVLSVIAGIVTIVASGAAGIAILIVGPLSSWIGSWALYAVGEVVDKLDSIEKHLTKGESTESEE